MQTIHFEHMFFILRQASAHHRAMAEQVHRSFVPKHYARSRASRLGLVVDTIKAANCPQKQISVNPLPLLSLTPSPKALIIRIPVRPRNPIVSHMEQISPKTVIRFVKSPHISPQAPTFVAQAAAPLAPVALRSVVPFPGPASRWSVDSNDDSEETKPRKENAIPRDHDAPMDINDSSETSEDCDLLNDYEFQYPATAEIRCSDIESLSSDGSIRSVSSGYSSLSTPNDEEIVPVVMRGKRKAMDDLTEAIPQDHERHPKVRCIFLNYFLIVTPTHFYAA